MISFTRYINIISGVGAGAGVRNRELILRVLTTNGLIPPGIVIEFGNADAVSAYFGSSSPEYARAARYFGFVSKSIRSPRKISFGRFVDTDLAPMIVGDSAAKTLNPWLSITTGTLNLTIDTAPIAITAIDTSAATSLTDVASIIQTALRAESDAQLTTCTVTFNTNTNQFVFTGSVTGSGDVICTGGTVANLLGWDASGAVNVPGQLAQTPAEAIAASEGVSSNFGSFLFQPVLVPSTEATEISAVALWNHTKNNRYMYLQASPSQDAGDLWDDNKGNSGMGVTVQPAGAFDYSDQIPAEILAATDYTAVNGAQSYMYYSFGNRTVTVSDDLVADQMDAVRANYIGVTETAGQQLAFYQRGVLFGDATAAVDMNVYANEMWLKDYIGAAMMELLLNLPTLPANEDGRSLIMSVLQTSTEAAKTNGTISAGKTLTNIQRQYITQITGNPNAWRQVQDAGSYFDVNFTSETTVDNRTEYTANYQLVYGKADQIRKVNGSNVLI